MDAQVSQAEPETRAVRIRLHRLDGARSAAHPPVTRDLAAGW